MIMGKPLRIVKHYSAPRDSSNTNGVNICNWAHTDIVSKKIRIYHAPIEDIEGMGFYFSIIKVEYVNKGFKKRPFKDPNLIVSVLAQGNYSPDRLEHLQFGEEGYIYRPDFLTFKKAMTKLEQLQETYCIKYSPRYDMSIEEGNTLRTSDL